MELRCATAVFLLTYFAGIYADTNELDIDDIQKTLHEIPGFENDTSIPSMEEVERVIQQKCEKIGGSTAFDNLQLQKESLQICIQNNINFTVVQDEVEVAKKDGSMDEVFGRYCKRIPDLMLCVKNVTEAAGQCLEGKEKDNLAIVLNITESLLEFICDKDGDRIAMFIAEGGVECLETRKDALQNCVNATVAGRAPKELNVETLPFLMFEAQDCRDFDALQQCCVAELEKCRDHTPANIVDALFKFVRRVTPCAERKEEAKVLGVRGSGSSLGNYFTYLAVATWALLRFL